MKILNKNKSFIKEIIKITSDYDNFKIILDKNNIKKYNLLFFDDYNFENIPNIYSFEIKKKDYESIYINDSFVYFSQDRSQIKILIDDIKSILVSINNIEYMFYFNMKSYNEIKNDKNYIIINNIMKNYKSLCINEK